MSNTHPKSLVTAIEIDAALESYTHPWTPNSLMYGKRMSELTGLTRSGVSKVTIPPGKESFVYHSHECEDECIYILSGRGIAKIDGEEYIVES